MKRMFPIALSCVLLAAAGCASTPASSGPGQLPAEGPVAVSWNDPLDFSERPRGRDRYDAARATWVRELALHLRDQATRSLPPGQRLEVVLLDVDRAGEYEPWHGPEVDDVRIMRDMYPPRIRLGFRHLDADGRVLAEGERRLVGSAHLIGSTMAQANDALRYEKRVLDDWLRREFATP